ncbi:D-alanyl-D-alanine carboxypeptidase/D-alanyl-D-alanine-endopeptidase [Sphingobacterium sp. UT-1RO-CII-1]|nr:D-alanyl-D-alanine carboxypeptidase/D-alanyl-D-alanine-endopeptidase [Sphingobacterium sp. UT-1RO-CII-1]
MMFKSFYKFYLICLIFSVQVVYGQSVKESVPTAFQQFVSSGKLPNGIASLTVLDGKTGQVLFEKNSTIGLSTASTLKVITSITALDILGANYTYKTTLSYTGDIDSLGVLNGDIILTGTGDPTLGSDRYTSTKEEVLLNKWVYKIKNAGIKQVNGRIIADDLHWGGNTAPAGWAWEDLGNYYGAGVSGLNWRENKMGVVFRHWSIGQPATIEKLVPNVANAHIVNEVTTASQGAGDNVYAFSAPYTELIYLRGSLGRDLKKTIEIAVPDPALDAAHQLHQALISNEVWVDSLPTTGKRLMNTGEKIVHARQDLDVHNSPPLHEIVYWFNQKSVNLYGEALLKTIGLLSHNKSDTRESGELVAKYWEQKLKIPTSELRILDGSGLTAQNRITTLAMSRIMHYAQSRPWFEIFHKSLPTINGMSMKSGTIGGVLGYTGYHTTSKGEAVTFTLLVNNYVGTASNMRQEMFKLLNTMK